MVLELDKADVGEIVKIGKALSNKYRKEILNLCADEEHNITEIQKKVDIAYPHVHNHVWILKDAGLVETHEETNDKGKNVMIKSKYKIKGDKLYEA